MTQLSRQVRYGLGAETTPGTQANASAWFNQLKFELNPVNDIATNSSAWGNLVKTNSSTVVRKHVEGSANAKLTPDLGGLVLAGAMGNVSTVANSDASGLVYDHTINLSNNINGKTFTLYRQGETKTEAFTNGRIGKWELSLDLDDYIQYTADLYANIGTAATTTVVDSEDVEFVASHLNVKQATTISGIGSATNQSLLQSFTVTCDPNIDIDKEAGNKNPAGYTSRGYDLKFEAEAYYNDTTFEDAYNNGTFAAFQVTVLNDDEIIGTAAHPKFVLTAPRVSITDWSRDEGKLDDPVTQKFTGTIHYSPADLYALRAVVTNRLATLF